MKKPIVIEILIWITILLVLIGAGIFTYKKFFVQPNVYVIQFKDIDGITKGSPVRFMGINIGYVRKLKSKNKYIDVQILVTKKGMNIPNGTLARVEFYGLGGSKSIELMPPETSCEVGILTGNTIRLNDVAHEAISIVEIIEMIEKYVKNINQKGVEKLLIEMKTISDDKIKSVGSELENIEGGISGKFENVKLKQHEMNKKIKDVNSNIEKLNEFIKK
jgi:ABC-type transporter Mla subunit MlaD